MNNIIILLFSTLLFGCGGGSGGGVVDSGGVGSSTPDEDQTEESPVSGNINIPPIANAGSDLSVNTGVILILDGSKSSDADGDSIRYKWEITSSPSGSSVLILGLLSSTPSFTPPVDGEYILKLTVFDGVDSSTDTVTVNATTAAGPPLINAYTITVSQSESNFYTVIGEPVFIVTNGCLENPVNATATLYSDGTINFTDSGITCDVDGVYGEYSIIGEYDVVVTTEYKNIYSINNYTSYIQTETCYRNGAIMTIFAFLSNASLMSDGNAIMLYFQNGDICRVSVYYALLSL